MQCLRSGMRDEDTNCFDCQCRSDVRCARATGAETARRAIPNRALTTYDNEFRQLQLASWFDSRAIGVDLDAILNLIIRLIPSESGGMKT